MKELLFPSLIPAKDTKEAPLEKILLGLIMFIPGSYHTIVAIMAAMDSGGFTYDDVSTFESDDWRDKDL